MKKLLILTIILSLLSCAISHKYRPAKKVWICELQKLGQYDTSCMIKENFLKGTTTLVFMDDDSCVVIWGKKCEFNRGDSLFVKAEWWAPGHWRYFLVDKNKTHKYSLLNRDTQ